jgi:hypothetical protein
MKAALKRGQNRFADGGVAHPENQLAHKTLREGLL